MSLFNEIIRLLAGDARADRVVPPTGFTAWLTILASAAMALLGTFALAFLLATDRLADRWASELAQSSTIRISAPADQIERQLITVLEVLEQTPGVASAREIAPDEQARLLSPWLGPDVPLDALPLPVLVEVIETPQGYDAQGLRLRLQADAPGAVLDDHTRWRRPLIDAASRLRSLGVLSILVIGGVMAALITLAASAALAANAKIIGVLRLVGARDTYIARAFVRRFTLRAATGACVGAVLGGAAIAALPDSGDPGAFLTGLGFQGGEWALLLLLPLGAAVVAFWATRYAAFARLRSLT
ncbi:MAG: FtsX-like permease family protein [Pseudomonadota bacterium]